MRRQNVDALVKCTAAAAPYLWSFLLPACLSHPQRHHRQSVWLAEPCFRKILLSLRPPCWRFL